MSPRFRPTRSTVVQLAFDREQVTPAVGENVRQMLISQPHQPGQVRGVAPRDVFRKLGERAVILDGLGWKKPVEIIAFALPQATDTDRLFDEARGLMEKEPALVGLDIYHPERKGNWMISRMAAYDITAETDVNIPQRTLPKEWYRQTAAGSPVSTPKAPAAEDVLANTLLFSNVGDPYIAYCYVQMSRKRLGYTPCRTAPTR